MSSGGGAQGRLAVAINAARQHAQKARGVDLPAELADAIAEHLRAAQKLLAGKPARPSQRIEQAGQPPRIQKGTARYQLWERSPFCFWCGRLTRIEAVHEDDSATLDHLQRRGERDGRAILPPFVLACRACNRDRGQPRARRAACPVIIEQGREAGRVPSRRASVAR